MTETVVTIDPNRNPSAGQPKSAGIAQPGGQQRAFLTFNFTYYRTVPGILKLVQLLIGIICMACSSPAILSGTHFFLFVVVSTFIATLLWTFAYLLGIREVLNLAINWILTEFINTGIASLLYLVASIVQLTSWGGYRIAFSWYSSNIAAGVFGFFNTIAYGAGAYFLWVEHRSTTLQ